MRNWDERECVGGEKWRVVDGREEGIQNTGNLFSGLSGVTGRVRARRARICAISVSWEEKQWGAGWGGTWSDF